MSSVPVERRDTGELNVNTEARRMCAYTLKITANPKTFDTAHKDMIDMIRADAMDKYYINLWKGVDENEDHETGTVPGPASGA